MGVAVLKTLQHLMQHIIHIELENLWACSIVFCVKVLRAVFKRKAVPMSYLI